MTQINLDNLSDEVKAFFRSLPRGRVITFTLNGQTFLGISSPQTDDEREASARRMRNLMEKARRNCEGMSDEEIERLVNDAVDEVRRSQRT